MHDCALVCEWCQNCSECTAALWLKKSSTALERSRCWRAAFTTRPVKTTYKSAFNVPVITLVLCFHWMPNIRAKNYCIQERWLQKKETQESYYIRKHVFSCLYDIFWYTVCVWGCIQLWCQQTKQIKRSHTPLKLERYSAFIPHIFIRQQASFSCPSSHGGLWWAVCFHSVLPSAVWQKLFMQKLRPAQCFWKVNRNSRPWHLTFTSGL